MQHGSLTSRLHQVDAPPHKVEAGLIKIRCTTGREQGTHAQINRQLTMQRNNKLRRPSPLFPGRGCG